MWSYHYGYWSYHYGYALSGSLNKLSSVYSFQTVSGNLIVSEICVILIASMSQLNVLHNIT